MKFTYADLAEVFRTNGHDVKEINERDFSICCPFCPDGKGQKMKCYVTPEHDYGSIAHCFYCGFSGSVYKIFKKLGIQAGKISLDTGSMKERIIGARRIRAFAPKSKKRPRLPDRLAPIDLPEGTQSLLKIRKSMIGSKAIAYLRRERGMSRADIGEWEISYCSKGTYSGHLILPIKDRSGSIVNFQSRRLLGSIPPKSLNPVADVDEFSTSDVFYGMQYLKKWDYVVLVEGPFDVIALRRLFLSLRLRNFTPLGLLGHQLSPAQMGILKDSSPSSVYVMMDADVPKDAERMALDLSRELETAPVYLVTLQDEDPDELSPTEAIRYLLSAREVSQIPSLRA